MSDDTVQGIDAAAVTTWFTERVEVTPPLSFDLITGGHSNLTFKVTDAEDRAWVLRRPPLGQVLATAHDMGREHRIISALAPTDVPVAPTIGLSADDSVNGAPFYVMDFVEGHIVRNRAAAEALDLKARTRAGEDLVDVLARIHAVQPAAVGLDDLGRHEGYIERQLKRWYGQWEKSKTRELSAIDEVHDALLAAVPEQQGVSIVHGDYRLDNCMLADDGTVAAVLDWEICTLGDPLADMGLLLVYWADRDDPFSALPDSATTVDGFPTKAELLARYAEVSGRDVSRIDFYVAFGYWKLACILEGVLARYMGGAMGSSTSGWEVFKQQVDSLAVAAHSTLAGTAPGSG
jgi:aminoglycoside phosphotransferase (APT) family kinase protein